MSHIFQCVSIHNFEAFRKEERKDIAFTVCIPTLKGSVLCLGPVLRVEKTIFLLCIASTPLLMYLKAAC